MEGWRLDVPGDTLVSLYTGIRLRLARSHIDRPAAKTLLGSDSRRVKFGLYADRGRVSLVYEIKHRRLLGFALRGILKPPWEEFQADTKRWEDHRHIVELMYEHSMALWWRLPESHHCMFANLASYMVTGILGGYAPQGDHEVERLEHITKTPGLIGISCEAAQLFAEEWAYPADINSVPIKEIMEKPVCISAVVHVGGMFDRTFCECRMDDGTEFEMEFYPDEIMFSEAELVGKTAEEIRSLKGQKDLAYLKS